MEYNIKTNRVASMHNFTGFSSISLSGEGDISFDSDRLAVLADGKWGFVYTISSGEISQTVDLAQYGGFLDVIDMTPSNNVVLIHDQPGGVELFDTGMNHLGQVLDYQGHSDRARDINNRDTLVITNSADFTPLPSCQSGIVKVLLPSGEEHCLLELNWSLAVHVSCNNYGQGWCLVSTYSTNFSVPYANELLYVSLARNKVIRLGHTRSSNREYERISRAAISGNGKYVVFDSDMGGSTVDSYLLYVPTSLNS